MSIPTPPTDPSHAHGLAKARIGMLPALLFVPGVAAANDPEGAIADFASLLESALEPDGAVPAAPVAAADSERREEPEACSATGLETLAAVAALPIPSPAAARSCPLPAAGDAAETAITPAAQGPKAGAHAFPAEPPAGPARDAPLARSAPASPAPAAAPLEQRADGPLVADLPGPAASAAPEQMAPPAPAAPHPHAAEFHVGPRLGAPGFDEAFAARVGIAVRSGIETASITLNPPELGPVDMQIDVSDGKASVQFAAEHPLTREAIVEALPRLREMLAAHGLDLAGSSVGAELPRRDTPARPAGSGSAHALHDEPAAEARVAAGAVVTRLVDTFA